MKMRIVGAMALSAMVMAGCDKAAKTEDELAKSDVVEEIAEEPARDPNEVSIEVNGQKLTRGEIDADIAKIMANQNIPAAQKGEAKKYFQNQLVNAFLMKTLLLAKAKELGVTATDEDFKAREAEFLKSNENRPDAPKTIEEACEKSPFGKERGLQEFKEGVLIEKLIKQVTADKIKVDPAEVEKILKDCEKRLADTKAENAKIKEENAKINVEEGLAKAKEKIDELKKQLDAGADFAELAKANSDCPSKSSGGSLGAFGRGQMVKEFEDVAFTLEPGKVSDPVKTQFGWHLILVTKRNAKADKADEIETVEASHILIKGPELRREMPEQPVPPKEDVEKYLKNQAEGKAVREFFEELRNAATINTSDEFAQFKPQPKEEPKAEEKPAEEAK